MIDAMCGRRLRCRSFAIFALLVVLGEVAGRSIISRVDRTLHVEPLAPQHAAYYPLLLVGVKVAGALTLAALLARLLRARATAEAGERLMKSVGRRPARSFPRLRANLSPRTWLAFFACTSLLYLAQADAARPSAGRWPLLAPWLHTYALPVFAAVAVLMGLAWSLARWLRAVEEYAYRTIERAKRIMRQVLTRVSRRPLADDDAAPRRRFGLAFESRPPPSPA
jgi:hypothetical protein